jgi:hypothetical protein
MELAATLFSNHLKWQRDTGYCSCKPCLQMAEHSRVNVFIIACMSPDEFKRITADMPWLCPRMPDWMTVHVSIRKNSWMDTSGRLMAR